MALAQPSYPTLKNELLTTSVLLATVISSPNCASTLGVQADLFSLFCSVEGSLGSVVLGEGLDGSEDSLCPVCEDDGLVNPQPREEAEVGSGGSSRRLAQDTQGPQFHPVVNGSHVGAHDPSTVDRRIKGSTSSLTTQW